MVWSVPRSRSVECINRLIYKDLRYRRLLASEGYILWKKVVPKYHFGVCPKVSHRKSPKQLDTRCPKNLITPVAKTTVHGIVEALRNENLQCAALCLHVCCKVINTGINAYKKNCDLHGCWWTHRANPLHNTNNGAASSTIFGSSDLHTYTLKHLNTHKHILKIEYINYI
jgi:hypothetical protein